MAKTAAKQPIGPPELDAHISMYEPAKWPLTKRDQTYLSQANKFWNFISTDAFLVGLCQLLTESAYGSMVGSALSCLDAAELLVIQTCHHDSLLVFGTPADVKEGALCNEIHLHLH